MKVKPKRSFLLRQEDVEGSARKKDVYATKGKDVEVSEKEAIRFWGSFEFKTEADKKKLLQISRDPNKAYKRLV